VRARSRIVLSRWTFAAVLASCGPPLRLHPDAEHGCTDIVLHGQDDVAAAAGCRTVDSLTIKTGMALDLTPLGRLETVKGPIVVGPSVGMTELALPHLRTAASIQIVSNGNLQRCQFPALVKSPAIEIENNATLFTLSMPALLEVGRLSLRDNAALESIDFTKLASATDVVIEKNPKLTMIDGELPALRAAGTTTAPVEPAPESHD
jgi:hypothetical protein